MCLSVIRSASKCRSIVFAFLILFVVVVVVVVVVFVIVVVSIFPAPPPGPLTQYLGTGCSESGSPGSLVGLHGGLLPNIFGDDLH